DDGRFYYMQDWTHTWLRSRPSAVTLQDANMTVFEGSTRAHIWPLLSDGGGENCGQTCEATGGCDGLGGVRDACGVCRGDSTTCQGCDGVQDGGLSARARSLCGTCGEERQLIVRDALVVSDDTRGLGAASFVQEPNIVFPLFNEVLFNAIANRYELRYDSP